MFFAPFESEVFQPDFLSVFESLPGAYIVLLPSPEHQIVAISDEYLRVTLTRREDLLGKSLFEAFPTNPEDTESQSGVQRFRESIARILMQKKADSMAMQKYDIPRAPHDGGGYEVRYWNPVNAPVLDKMGNVRFIIHRVEDVTSLVMRTQERDAALLDLHRLRRESDGREQFVSMLTHDLRNPLSAARASAQMIPKNFKNPERVSILVNRIVNSIVRADRMLTNLLDANRIKSGEKLPLEIQETGLHAMLTEVVEEMTSIHGNRFVLDSEPVVKGYWSRDGLRRVIENLANNAVKYGFPNTPITLKAREKDETIQIDVHNEGHFLDMKERENLFKAFHRGSNDRHPKSRGWGLGLTLVRGITESHGGHVEIDSAPGKGVTFKVILPRDARPFQSFLAG